MLYWKQLECCIWNSNLNYVYGDENLGWYRKIAAWNVEFEICLSSVVYEI